MSNRMETMFTQWMSGNLSSSDFEWFEQRMPPWRRGLIARTETISASNKGSLELYRAWGTKLKEWLATPDERVRTFENSPWGHLESDGETVLIDKPFVNTSESLMYPGDKDGSPGNTINCRCTIVPVFENIPQSVFEGSI